MASLHDLLDPWMWSQLPRLDTGSQEERGTDSVCVCVCTRERVVVPVFRCAFCVRACVCVLGVSVLLLFSRSVVSDSL